MGFPWERWNVRESDLRRGELAMRDRHKALAWKSWVAIGTLLVLVGVALAQPQAQRRGRGARDPLRDQGGVPLKKARPEAADPLAKVAAAPVTA